MPRARKTANAALDRIARLPRLPDLVIEGGKRPLAVWLREGNETVQPQVAIWLDSRSGFIRATRVISPLDGTDDGLGETLEALLEAFTGPFLALPTIPPPQPARRGGRKWEPDQWSPQPGQPSRVVVDDAALAEAARALLAPLDVPVEQVERLPAFEEAFESLSAAMGADPAAGPPEPFAWEIDPALLPPLYKAAAGYARRAPWGYMPDHPAIVVRLGEHGPRPGVDTLYACILGGGGMVRGVAFYYSPDAVERAAHAGEELSLDDDEVDAAIALLRQSGAPVDQVPPAALREMVAGLAAVEEPGEDAGLAAMEDGLVCFVEPAEESDPTYLAWLAERGLKFSRRQGVPSFFRTVRGGEPELPDAREVKALTIAIEAINQFVSHSGARLAGPAPPAGGLSYVARVKSGGE